MFAGSTCDDGKSEDGRDSTTSDIYTVEDDTWRAGPNLPGAFSSTRGKLVHYDGDSFLARMKSTGELMKVRKLLPHNARRSIEIILFQWNGNGWTGTGTTITSNTHVVSWVDKSIFKECTSATGKNIFTGHGLYKTSEPLNYVF